MSIYCDESTSVISINTGHSTYQMKITEHNFLLHSYYGRRVGRFDMSYLYMNYDRGCSTTPDEVYPSRAVSLDVLPQEYSGHGTGDFRASSVIVKGADGSEGVDLRYEGYEIMPGKYSIDGLPCAYDNGDEAQTLIVTLSDRAANIAVKLIYGVFEDLDIITRCARVINRGKSEVLLEKAMSVCLDFPYGDLDLINFFGKHCKERQLQRKRIAHSTELIRSNRGISSHQQSPFIVLCDHDANEDAGNAYGIMLTYSGSFQAEVEKDQFGSVRALMGIGEDSFCWRLAPGQSFDTPEAVMCHSGCGFAEMSHRFHCFIRRNICRGKYKTARRPVLLNNWEATYFNFDDQKLLRIAKDAKALGVDMLVLDDGWFGTRNDDNAGLGDWFVNEAKIRCGLKNLADQINETGLKFGLWIEPEMVNEDSDLYRAHPDWVLAMPGRKPARVRNQLVLDMGRKVIRDYLYERIASILGEANIEYVKWDMNRSLCDLYSRSLPAEAQGEVSHRYVLGLYELMGRLTSDFPEVLFEGCAGGGGRFDTGVLSYCPQIWGSDDTDPIHRLQIQYGTSFGFPVSAVGSHVSASPNHQTGRSTPLNTRAVVAMSGTFGYELDPGQLSFSEKEQISRQIETFKRHYDLIQDGKFYRLTEFGAQSYESWMFVSPDKSEALLNLVITDVQPNPQLINVKLKGLDFAALYKTKEKTTSDHGQNFGLPVFSGGSKPAGSVGSIFAGGALMFGGYTFPWVTGDYPAMQVFFKKVNDLK